MCTKCPYPSTTGYGSQVPPCHQVAIDASYITLINVIILLVIIYSTLIISISSIKKIHILVLLIHSFFPFLNLISDVYYLLNMRFVNHNLYWSCIIFIIIGPVLWWLYIFIVDCIPILKPTLQIFKTLVYNYLPYYKHKAYDKWDHSYKCIWDVMVLNISI